MAASTRSKPEAEVEVEEPVDDVWARLQTVNHIPPLEFAGIRLVEPTKTQIDDWANAPTIEAGERALFADQYDAIQSLFADKPKHVWENFNKLYMAHFFGAEGAEELKG